MDSEEEYREIDSEIKDLEKDVLRGIKEEKEWFEEFTGWVADFNKSRAAWREKIDKTMKGDI